MKQFFLRSILSESREKSRNWTWSFLFVEEFPDGSARKEVLFCKLLWKLYAALFLRIPQATW